MDVERLSIWSENLRTELLPRLKERVFHVTTVDGFLSISEDGAIRHNRDNRYPLNHSVSKASYFRTRGCVCLCDLRSVSDEDLENALFKYNFLNPLSTGDMPVFMILSHEVYADLLPWTEWKKAKPTESMVVPFIEAGYPGKITLTAVERTLIVEVKRKPNPFDPVRTSQGKD